MAEGRGKLGRIGGIVNEIRGKNVLVFLDRTESTDMMKSILIVLIQIKNRTYNKLSVGWSVIWMGSSLIKK